MKTRIFFAIALLFLNGCATRPLVKMGDLHSAIEEADTAFSRLPSALPAYNRAVQELAEKLEKSGPAKFADALSRHGVAFEYPHIGLPLNHVEVPDPPADANSLGIHVLLEYDTANAPLHPPGPLCGCDRSL